MKRLPFFFLLFFSIILIGCSTTKKSLTMNIATFNVLMDTKKDHPNAWKYRKEMVKGLVRFHDFDIVGTQEAFKHQLTDVLELGNYAYTGSGRDDGKDAGEHSAIVYKKERFDLLENGDFWFADTLTCRVRLGATCCNQDLFMAKFKDKETGKVFLFSTHITIMRGVKLEKFVVVALKENRRDCRR